MKYIPILTALALSTGTAAIAQHGGGGWGGGMGGGGFLQEYDTDHDGTVTRAEFDAVRDAQYKAMDGNGDGSVSEEEYVADFTKRLDAHLSTSTDSADDKAAQRARQLEQAHRRFGFLDTDKDGKLSKAEYDASGARGFAMLDENKDGAVTSADIAAATARRQAEREARGQN
jgi:Ca2+-binding EF-hand superfamily protein